MSCQPCGCDPEANYYCRTHLSLNATTTTSGFIERGEMKTQDVVSLAVNLPSAPPEAKIQQFNSGATRSSEGHKFDYEGFVNPQAEHVFAEYMHTHRFQRDGSIRDSDNWQKGIPFANYMRSMVRHMFDAWRLHRGYAVTDPDTGNPATMSDLMCAIRFNAMGYLKEIHDPSPINGGKA